MIIKRNEYVLDRHEKNAFDRLPPVAGAAWDFWKEVAKTRGLDYRSILPSYRAYRFTALPLNHGKWWNYPYSRFCANQPPRLAEAQL